MPNIHQTIKQMQEENKTLSAGGPGSGRHPEYGKMAKHLASEGYKHSWQHPTKANVQVFSTAPKSQGTSEQVHVNRKTAGYKQVMTDNGKVNRDFDSDGGKGLSELQEELG